MIFTIAAPTLVIHCPNHIVVFAANDIMLDIFLNAMKLAIISLSSIFIPVKLLTTPSALFATSLIVLRPLIR